jgi:hypothetical protein
MARLHRAGVAILHHQRLRRLHEADVELENIYDPGVRTRVHADTLVLAVGREPRLELFEPLAELGVDTIAVGDCVGPRSIEEAILEATLALRDPGAPALPTPLRASHRARSKAQM